jgi:hypothetical protein
MNIGVFVPISNNGKQISENAPRYMSSFELNKIVAQKAAICAARRRLACPQQHPSRFR